ncbi:MAG: excinuclease ABC subunit C, partial [Nanoarchaeota archaeon]
RLLDQGGELPDLIVIDGGKGQLSSAIQAMKEAGVKIPMISIAKKFEEIYVPGKLKPHPVSHDGLQLLRAIRDEAHRFAITYNRLLRSKEYRDELLEE